MRPAVIHLSVSFVDGHPERSVSHGEGNEFLPVFGPGDAASHFQALEKRSAWKRSEQAEDWQAGRPASYLLQGTLGRANGVVVHSKDERSDGVDIALSESLEYGGIFLRLVKAFVHIFQVGRIDRLHADKYPFTA